MKQRHPQTSASALEHQRLRSVSAAVEEVTENIRNTQSQLSSKGEQIELLKNELSTTANKTAQLQAQVSVLTVSSVDLHTIRKIPISVLQHTISISDHYKY